jgi:hypothetical protein
LYKLDIVLLKQKKLPVLDITGFLSADKTRLIRKRRPVTDITDHIYNSIAGVIIVQLYIIW